MTFVTVSVRFMFKDDVKVDCEDIEDKLKKKGFNVNVGKFN